MEITMEPARRPSLFGRIRGLVGGRRARRSASRSLRRRSGPVTGVGRTVEFGDPARGAYVLTVRITDPAGGATLVRRRRIEVVSPAAS
jgi:hypothetical protein